MITVQEPESTKTQEIFIPLDEYVFLKKQEQMLLNVRRFINADKESAFIDKKDLKLLLGIVGGDE